MLNQLLATTLLTLNTYYPLEVFKSPLKTVKMSNNIVLYNKCLFYNNSCSLPINQIYQDIHKHNNVYCDDFDININTVISKLKNLENTTNYKITEINYNHYKVNLNSDYFKELQVIFTPIKDNVTRIFIFNSAPNYKKTLLYYNLKFMLNRIVY